MHFQGKKKYIRLPPPSFFHLSNFNLPSEHLDHSTSLGKVQVVQDAVTLPVGVRPREYREYLLYVLG